MSLPLSRTRDLVAALRRARGAEEPMAPRERLPPVPLPPERVFPSPRRRSRLADAAAAHTTALVGIGAVGTRYATDVVLQFQAELAVAHGAVATELPPGWADTNQYVSVSSRVADHRQFLLRPDLGRRLSEDSASLWAATCRKDVDVQPILADGLSAVATMGAGPTLMAAFIAECEARGMSVGTPVCARFARVWLQDEIGQLARARVAAILLGERPGLGTGDGLSAYLVYSPQLGRTDGNRNMMSNIHARGIPPADAARRLAVLAQLMLEQRTSGVELDLAPRAAELGDAARGGYRPPVARARLVEV
ncbi:MAG: ethanolamine ammonia-lyase subunit EutC [Myxococcales bacterium]|nr:ethanolamine ammonia-lyase subunit EutC [Myxococcales bacterium]